MTIVQIILLVWVALGFLGFVILAIDQLIMTKGDIKSVLLPHLLLFIICMCVIGAAGLVFSIYCLVPTKIPKPR